MFQFPSNGKVYSEDGQESGGPSQVARFNSLQTGKCIQSSQGRLATRSYSSCFNSLQTGKCIQSSAAEEVVDYVLLRFNSLQTGKCIQSPAGWAMDVLKAYEFQFPSNGKVYSETLLKEYGQGEVKNVSIPFKRESVFRGSVGQRNLHN